MFKCYKRMLLKYHYPILIILTVNDAENCLVYASVCKNE